MGAEQEDDTNIAERGCRHEGVLAVVPRSGAPRAEKTGDHRCSGRFFVSLAESCETTQSVVCANKTLVTHTEAAGGSHEWGEDTVS